jgi:SAM-dependent methyltransferase
MRCRFCGVTEGHQEFVVREMMLGLKDQFVYSQCPNCECLQAAEILADLSRYYPREYFDLISDPPGEDSSWPVPGWCATMTGGPIVKHLEVVRDLGGDWDRTLTERAVQFYLSRTNVRRSGSAPSSILDVGTASGGFLRSLKKVGFSGLLMGVEPGLDRDGEFDDGVMIRKGTIFDVAPGQTWDLITFHHSFEHVPNPLETLQAASTLLSEEGVCLIRTPVVPCYAWQHYGVNWVSIDAPRHCFIPSVKSMDLLAERSNLQLKEVIYDSTAFQFWASEQYLKNIPFYSERSFAVNPMNSATSLMQIPIFERRAEELNQAGQGDQAAFYLVHKQGRLIC